MLNYNQRVMYCKHCGKEIADDSVFCQYCGGELQEQEKKKPNGSLLNRFQSLSKGWQITIMAYSVWLLAGACVLIGNSDYGRGFVEDVLLPVVIVAVVLPLLALFIWYYFARLRKPKVDNQKAENDSTSSSTKSGLGIKMFSFSLMDFANQHGKMQVKTVANPTTDEVRSYCVFVSEQGMETKVEFGKTLGVLRPQEIAERKEQLMVVQRMDGTFELVEK